MRTSVSGRSAGRMNVVSEKFISRAMRLHRGVVQSAAVEEDGELIAFELPVGEDIEVQVVETSISQILVRHGVRSPPPSVNLSHFRYAVAVMKRHPFRHGLSLTVCAFIAAATLSLARARDLEQGSARRARQPGAVAHVFRRLLGPPAQPADADHAGERARNWRRSGRFRPASPASSKRRRSSIDGMLYVDRSAEHAWAIDGRTGRADLALPAARAEGRQGLLRPRQSRLRDLRRSPLSWRRSTPTSWRST